MKDTTEQSEEHHLTTINYDTLNGLREEGQTTEMHSAAKQGPASQEVGEELISTCYPDQDKNHSACPLKATYRTALVCIEVTATFFQ